MSHGCFSREPLREYAIVQDGWEDSPSGLTRFPKMIRIKDPMTKSCQYTLTELGKVDPKCHECKHKEPA